MDKEQVRDLLNQPNGTQNASLEACFDGAYELLKDGNGTAIAFMVRAVKQRQYKEKLQDLLKDGSLLKDLMGSEEPKVRKNTARLIGALGEDTYTETLIQALQQEEKRMVRPSILLALGVMQNDAAEAAIRTYEVQPPKDASEEKHYKEELQAKQQALASYQTTKRHPFKRLTPGISAEFRCGRGLEAVLLRELEMVRIPARKLGPGRIGAKIFNEKALEQVRTWRELLFPFGTVDVKENAGKVAAEQLVKLCRSSLEGTAPYSYRIELRGSKVDRSAMSRKLVAEIAAASKELINAPSAYEVELRVEKHRDRFHLFGRLWNMPDHRFDYRLGALPASIHPTTAAGVIEIASEFLTPGAKVLDPCCGSGTMLIERALYDTCYRISGVDIAKEAIAIAEKNTRAAGLSADLIVKNCMRYEARDKFDEVISNLPFGNRVGNHETNVELYDMMFRKLPQWLKHDGIAIFYTMEVTLMQEMIRKYSRSVQQLRYVRTEAGGLEPGIFILKVR